MNPGRAVTRRYVEVSYGQVHLAESGRAVGGPPVVMLHQTPRSWDEYREVLPLLGRFRWTVALDTPGMGASDPHPDGDSIESYAAGICEAVTALGAAHYDLVGHHTGGVIAVEVAALDAERVHRVVLSSTPYVDEEGRALRRERPPMDAVEVRPDGSHLTELWQRRRRFYPEGRADLLTRFVADALRVREAEAGHLAVASYEMERRLPHLTGPVLLVGHSADPYAFPELGALASRLPQAETTVVDGGMVPLEFRAEAFADAVAGFLRR